MTDDQQRKHGVDQETGEKVDVTPDYSRTCEVCGATPVVPQTGLCGPCTFGDIETVDGNW